MGPKKFTFAIITMLAALMLALLFGIVWAEMSAGPHVILVALLFAPMRPRLRRRTFVLPDICGSAGSQVSVVERNVVSGMLH